MNNVKSGAVGGKRTIDIERLLIWTYQAQKAETVTLRRHGAAASVLRGGSNAAAIANLMALGCRVDSPGQGERFAALAAGDDLNPDAEAVHEAVMAMGGDLSIEIRRCATSGLRPDWLPEGQRLVGLESARRPGRARVDGIEYAKGRFAQYCPVRVENGPEVLAFHRDLYAAWWQGLAALAARLRAPGVLREHWPVGPAAPARPWVDADGAAALVEDDEDGAPCRVHAAE